MPKQQDFAADMTFHVYFDYYPIVPLVRLYGLYYTMVQHVHAVEAAVGAESMRSLRKTLSDTLYPAELELAQRAAQSEMSWLDADNDSFFIFTMCNECCAYPFPEADRVENELKRIARILGFPRQALELPSQYMYRIQVLHTMLLALNGECPDLPDMRELSEGELDEYFHFHPEEEMRVPLSYAVMRLRRTYPQSLWNKTKASLLFGKSLQSRVARRQAEPI